MEPCGSVSVTCHRTTAAFVLLQPRRASRLKATLPRAHLLEPAARRPRRLHRPSRTSRAGHTKSTSVRSVTALASAFNVKELLDVVGTLMVSPELLPVDADTGS